MNDERARYNEMISGLKRISVEYEEMLTFVSNSTGYSKFKGVDFETSRKAKSVQGTQGKGTNPVVVTDGDRYIEISNRDFNDAMNVTGAYRVQVTAPQENDDIEKAILDKVSNSDMNTLGVTEGARVRHKSFGEGVVLSQDDDMVSIDFLNTGIKKLSINTCEKSNLLSLVQS